MKCFIKIKELSFLDNGKGSFVAEKEKLSRQLFFERELEQNEFIERVRGKVISICNSADIVYYSMYDELFLEIKLISNSKSNSKIEKEISRINTFLNETFKCVEKISNPKYENDKLIKVIIEDCDKKQNLVNSIIKDLDRKSKSKVDCYFKTTKHHSINKKLYFTEEYSDFVINVELKNLIYIINLIKENPYFKNDKIVVTNESLRSKLFDLTGYLLSLQTHNWSSQRKVSDEVLEVAFISGTEEILVNVDNDINILNYKVNKHIRTEEFIIKFKNEGENSSEFINRSLKE